MYEDLLTAGQRRTWAAFNLRSRCGPTSPSTYRVQYRKAKRDTLNRISTRNMVKGMLLS